MRLVSSKSLPLGGSVAVLALILATLVTACTGTPRNRASGLKVVATTSVVAELVQQVGGDEITLTTLIGAGLDPHAYEPSAADLLAIADADVVFHNGLRLEAALEPSLKQPLSAAMLDSLSEARAAAGNDFVKVRARGARDGGGAAAGGGGGSPGQTAGPRIVALADALDKNVLLPSRSVAGAFDPHIWMDVGLWQMALDLVTESLAEARPSARRKFRENADRYRLALDTLDIGLKARATVIPAPSRMLVTAHDGFGYFGRAYGFQVSALRDSYATAEDSVADSKSLAALVVEQKIPAVFSEAARNGRSVEGVAAAARARDFRLSSGGKLFSDGVGAPGSEENTYAGMMRHNMETIVAGMTAR